MLACCLTEISLGEKADSRQEKEAVEVKMPTDPRTAHTLYVVSVGKDGERKIERRIRIGQRLTWNKIEAAERENAKLSKRFAELSMQMGLARSEERYLTCIHDVVLPDGSLIQWSNVLQMVGDVIVLGNGFMNSMTVRELIEMPEKQPAHDQKTDRKTPESIPSDSPATGTPPPAKSGSAP